MSLTKTLSTMLENIIRGKPALQKYLDAPLLAEREKFLESKSIQGCKDGTLQTCAYFTLLFAENLHLVNGNTAPVSIDQIVSVAKSWAAKDTRIHRGPRSSKSEAAFIAMAIDFFEFCGLLDERYYNATLNFFLQRKHDKAMLIAASFFQERMAFLEDCRTVGCKKHTLRKYAQYQLHIIEYLKLDRVRPVTLDEISSAAINWQDYSNPSEHKKKGTKGNLTYFIYFAQKWLSGMGMFTPERTSFLCETRINDYLNELRQRGYSDETIKGRSLVLNRFYDIIDKKDSVSPITLEDIDRFTKICRDKGLKRVTLKEYLNDLRCYLRYASEKDWCTANLDKAVVTPKIYDDENIPYFLPWDTVQQVLKKLRLAKGPSSNRDYAILSYWRLTVSVAVKSQE